jgi:hypothetical protein
MSDQHSPDDQFLWAASSPPPESLRDANINAMVAMADYLIVEMRQISPTAALFLLLARHELRTTALERSGLIIRFCGGEEEPPESESQPGTIDDHVTSE